MPFALDFRDVSSLFSAASYGFCGTEMIVFSSAVAVCRNVRIMFGRDGVVSIARMQREGV